MKTLTIRLAAPLQSYGNEINFTHRTTNNYPSKSAIIGMIAAALGYSRDDKRIQDLNKLTFAVRIDQPGKTLTDFQIVEWDLKKSERKLTYREYLQDAVFVVAIGGKSNEIDQIKTALMHPHYALFLGRKANVLAGILQLNEFVDQDPIDALEHLPWQASTWYQKRQKNKEIYKAQIIADANLLYNGKTIINKDQVGSFNTKNRYYCNRKLNTIWIKLHNPYFKSNTQHDVMASL